VSTPELSLVNNLIQIQYHILHSTPIETFFIRVEITNSEGTRLPAKTFSGDIGKHIPGGNDKLISWDFEADSIFLEDNIFVQVIAMPENPVQAEKIIQEEAKTFSRSSLMLQSLVFPGLGLSRINPGQPHWIKGIAAYACVGGSIYLNRKAISNYEAYLQPENAENLDDFYNASVKQDNASEILGFAAIGIWAADLIWTIFGTKSLDTLSYSMNQKGIYLNTGFDAVSKTPLLAFRYTF
jgi:hypothetical protein